MPFDEQNLREITINVFQSMLGLALCPLSSTSDIAHQLVASVEIRGAQNMVVDVFAHDQLMANIVEAMFDSERGNKSENDVSDAFCRIGNMVAGNVKVCFCEEASLSPSRYGSANDSLETIPHFSLRTTFECCGNPLTLVLRDVEPNPNPCDPSIVVSLIAD